MKKKYIVIGNGVMFESNSRNVRKHMIDTGCDWMEIWTNCANPDLSKIVCVAKLDVFNHVIMYGAVRKDGK